MTRLTTTLIISFLLLGLSLPVLAAPTEVIWYGQSAFRVVTPAGKVLQVDPWIVNPANPNGKQDLEGLQSLATWPCSRGRST